MKAKTYHKLFSIFSYYKNTLIFIYPPVVEIKMDKHTKKIFWALIYSNK